MFGRDPQHTSHNPSEKTLTRENAGSLSLSWTSRRGAAVTLEGGTLYYGAWDGQFYATSAATGEMLWQQFVGVASRADCPLSRGSPVRIDLRDPLNPVYRYLIPRNEVGSGIWSTPAYDGDTNTIYVTTGTRRTESGPGAMGKRAARDRRG